MKNSQVKLSWIFLGHENNKQFPSKILNYTVFKMTKQTQDYNSMATTGQLLYIDQYNSTTISTMTYTHAHTVTLIHNK